MIDDPFDVHDVDSDLDAGRKQVSCEGLTPPRYEVPPVSEDNVFKCTKVTHELGIRANEL